MTARDRDAVASLRAMCAVGGLERRRGHPQRLLDGDLGHAVDLDRGDRDPARHGPRHGPRRWCRRAGRPGPASSAITRVPWPSSLGRPASDSPGAESRIRACRWTWSASNAVARRRSRRRDRHRVGGQAASFEGTLAQPLERELLDRGPGAVGVEPDLAEEGAVGPRDRPFAHPHRVGAVEAVGEVAEAAAHPSGLLPGRPSTSIEAIARPGNSAAMCGATQPGSGAGSQPRSARRRRPPSQPFPRRPSLQQRVEPPPELVRG